MRLAFVVQRYGLEIAGGAEYHCRLIAEHLRRHAQVEVLTTCASDYVTWADHYPEGLEELGGVPVRRFRVRRPRDPEHFAEWSARVLRRPRSGATPGAVAPPPAAAPDAGGAWARLARRLASGPAEDPLLADELRWLEEEGPYSPRLVRHIERHAADFDAFVFFSYRYYTTYHGLRAVPHKALLVPTAEDDGVYRLRLFQPFFHLPRAIVYNSVEERAMLEAASGNRAVPGDVVGVGSALPERLDGAAFRRRHGLAGPFALYVGRIDENKGCRQLFDFFRRYRAESGSQLKLVLIGKAVLEPPDDPAIVPLGFQPDSEKWDALDACELLLMPSRYESLSMVTLEAWWAQRPVLANAQCDVLRGQCRRSRAGLYYAGYDEFAEALALLEREPGLRAALGRQGRAYYERHYAWDVIEGKYLALLDGAGLRPGVGRA